MSSLIMIQPGLGNLWQSVKKRAWGRSGLAVVALISAVAPFTRGAAVVAVGEAAPVDTAVVVASGGPNLVAGRMLVAMLERMTGQPVRLDHDNGRPNEPFLIHVGPTRHVKSLGLDLAALHPAGYRILLADTNNLVLAGGASHYSIYYAVFDFLKRYAGYRWFMPGELGEIVPSQPFIRIPESLDLRCEPDLVTFNDAGQLESNGNFTRSSRVNLLATHNLSNLFPPEKYGTAHPEYYPEVNGRRVVPGGHDVWQPCVSNPALVPIAMDWARDFLAGHPDAVGFSLGVNDGGGDCHCAACAALARKHGNAYIPFYNAVARQVGLEFPGKLVGFIAYGGAWNPPRDIQLEPNLYVEIGSGLREDFRVMQAWRNAGARHVGVYDYLYGVGNRYVVPRHYPRVIGNAWKHAFEHFGLRGAWVEGYFGSWVYDGARQYVLDELAWDMGQDIDALLDDYFDTLYVEAAADVKRFFDRIEEIYARKRDPLHPSSDWGEAQGSPAQLAEYTRADLEFLDQRLAAAARAVRDPNAAKRLRLLQALFGLSRLDIDTHLRIAELNELEFKSPRDIDKAIELANSAHTALAAKKAYALDESEIRAIFVKTTDPKRRLDDFKTVLQLRPQLDSAVDGAFSRITAHLRSEQDWPQIRRFWVDAAGKLAGEEERSFALSQIYREEQPDAKINLIPNPSFESEEHTEPLPAGTVDLAAYEWRALERRPPWILDTFPNSQTRYYWDPTVARTGGRSLSIRENQIRGMFQRSNGVKPGAVYRFSVWIRQEPPGRGGLIMVRWSTPRGWADEGPNALPMLRIDFPETRADEWTRVEQVFTVGEHEKGVSNALILMGAPRSQKADQPTWFDDIELVKLYDPGWRP